MTASAPVDRTMGIDDYSRLPDDGYRTELVRGRVVREPQPGYRHGNMQLQLGAILVRHIQRHRLDRVCLGPVGFVLERDPPTVRGPDLAVLSRSRIPASDHGGFIQGAPDLAIEIVSPSNTSTEIDARVSDYLNAGARRVWVVYPDTQTVIVHHTPSMAVSFGPGESLEGGEVLPGLHLDVSTIFQR
jgi:Uma2 family endonuclease